MKRACLWMPALLALAGCSADKGYALVSVLSAGGAFNDVAQLMVDVRNDPYNDALAYPQMRNKAAMYRFDETAPLTFSIGYRTSHHGSLVVGVTPVNQDGLPLGYGEAAATIVDNQVTKVTVHVTRGAMRPPRLDGGAGDGGMSCDPNVATSCSGGACFLDCDPQGSRAVPRCTTAGTKKAGEVCSKTEDCEAGAQCLRFDCANGMAVSTCLQFCKDNSQCASGSCSTPIPCGSAPTGYNACAQACDPVGLATQGCAPGLNCFVFQNETPDCDCIGAKRTKKNGDVCSSSDECLPGLLCVTMAGSPQVCRPICRLAAPACTAGTTCTKLVSPEFKTFGACL